LRLIEIHCIAGRAQSHAPGFLHAYSVGANNAEASQRRRMMSISTHDRISGTPARVKALGEFISYAKRQPGVVFMRKDAIAEWALREPTVLRV